MCSKAFWGRRIWGKVENGTNFPSKEKPNNDALYNWKSLVLPEVSVMDLICEEDKVSPKFTVEFMTLRCALLAEASRMATKLMGSVVGRLKWWLSPPSAPPDLTVDFAFLFPEERISKRSSSPQQGQQEQEPYCSVIGTRELRSHSAGMSPFWPVLPVRGMENSNVNALLWPPKPSINLLARLAELYRFEV